MHMVVMNIVMMIMIMRMMMMMVNDWNKCFAGSMSTSNCNNDDYDCDGGVTPLVTVVMIMIVMQILQVQCRRAIASSLHSTLQTRMPGCLVCRHHHHHHDNDDHDHECMMMTS